MAGSAGMPYLAISPIRHRGRVWVLRGPSLRSGVFCLLLCLRRWLWRCICRLWCSRWVGGAWSGVLLARTTRLLPTRP